MARTLLVASVVGEKREEDKREERERRKNGCTPVHV
jgi:hypothetical protein